MTQGPFDSFGAKKLGFWRRQFAPIPTRAQDTFDTIFAIVMPILVLVADPIVFKGNETFFGPPPLQDYQLLVYLISTVEIGLFLAWRTFRLRLRPFAAAFAGFFLAAAAFSAVIGFAILPLSLIGLIVLVGVFGFTPLLTAFVFLRNGVRVARVAATVPLPYRFAVGLMSAVLIFAVPAFTSMTVESAISTTVNQMIDGDETEAQLEAIRLRRFPFIPGKYTNRIASAYSRETDPVKRSTFNAVYRDITGEDLDIRQRIMLAD